MQLGVSEVLAKANDIKDETQRLIFLRQNAQKSILTVLQYALDPNIVWLLEPGLPEFEANKVNEGMDTMLHAEARRLYLFVKGGNDNLTDRKRKILFIQFLEMLSPSDVELISNIKEKKLPYENLSYDFIKKVFPDILPDKTELIVPEEKPTKAIKPKKVKVDAEKPVKVKLQEIKEPKPKAKRGAKKAKLNE